MFYYINGRAELIEPNLVVLDVGGVGYAVHTSLTSSSSVKRGETVKFYTFLNVKEDIFEIYGFAAQEELNFFKQLISISGVGVKAAVSILSVANVSRLALAIISGDEKLITQANGIGKKIAQRIILELRDKIAKSQGMPTEVGLQPSTLQKFTASDDAVAALEVLGYSRTAVAGALSGETLSGLNTEEIIRIALKKLM